MTQVKSHKGMSEIIKEIEEYSRPKAPAPSQITLQNWVDQLKSAKPVHTDEDTYQQRLIELVGSTDIVHAFTMGGEVFIGERVELVKEYLRLNPSKPFRIWLIDNGCKIEI